MTELLEAEVAGYPLARVLTVASMLLTVVLLLWSLSKGRRRSKVRPWFDIARALVQIAAVTAVAWFTGVTTPVGLVLGCVLLGLVVGGVQGSQLRLAVDGGKVFATRSLVGLVVWGAGLVLMQGAGLVNRVGLLRVGQGISWFSIGVTVGLIAGRALNLDRTLRAAASTTLVASVLVAGAIGILAADVDDATAQSCPSVAGYASLGLSSGNCKYSSNSGDGTGTIRLQTSRCGADLADAWSGLGGGAGSSVHVRADDEGFFPNTDGNDYSRFEKVFVLGANGIADISVSSFFGPNRDAFIAAAPALISAFAAPCAGSPTPTAGSSPGTAPQAPPQTRIVTEDLDPDAPAQFAPIEDEGDALRAEQEAAEQAAREAAEQEARERQEAEQAPVTAAPVAPEEFALPDQDEDALDTSGEAPPGVGETVTDREALAAAVGGLIAAAAAGAISWAEAIAQANDLLGDAGYARNADELVGRRRSAVDDQLRDRYGIDTDEPAADRFRAPPYERVVIGDGSNGPVGHLWDAHDGEWVTPHEARRRIDADRAVLEEDAERRAADAERRRRETEELDRESDERAAARRRVEEEEAAARVADQQRRADAYEQLERIRSAADRRGWGDVVDRIDNAFDEEGNIDPDYVDSLRDVLVNRIGREVGTPPTDPSLLAEFLRDVDEQYGDVIPDFLLDEVQHAMEETYFGDGLQSSLDALDESPMSRMTLGMLTGGGSEAYFQSRILGQAIIADIEKAEAAGVPYERLQILHAMADTLIRENAPINTAQLALQGEDVTAGQMLMAIVGDLGATADFREAATTLRGFGDGFRAPDAGAPRGQAEAPAGRAETPSTGGRSSDPAGPQPDASGRPAPNGPRGPEPGQTRGSEPSRARPDEPSAPRAEEPGTARPDEGRAAAGDGADGPSSEPPQGARAEDAGRTGVADADGARVDEGGARSGGEPEGSRVDEDASGRAGGEPEGSRVDEGEPGGSRVDEDASGRSEGEPEGSRVDEGASGRSDGEDASGRSEGEDGGSRADDDASGRADAEEGSAGDGSETGEAGSTPEPPDPAKGGVAPEVVNPDGSPVPDIDGVKPGTKLDGDDIRSAGYTPEQGMALRRVAEEHGVIIATRTTNPLSTRFLESGEAVPKPIWLKNKSISELDELIGGPRAAEAGKVGFFNPSEPRFLDGSPVPEGHPAWARYEQRLTEFKKLEASMKELEALDRIRIVDGAVEMRMPDGTYKPFAGDIDPVAILDAKTGKPISGSRYDEVIASLKDSNAQLQHGAEANMINDIVQLKRDALAKTYPVGSPEYIAGVAAAERDARALFESLNQNHLDGKETVIYSHSRGTYKGPQLERLDGYEQMTAGQSARGPGRNTAFWDPDAVPPAQQPQPHQAQGLRPRPRSASGDDDDRP